MELRAESHYVTGTFLKDIKQLPYQDDYISVPFITGPGWPLGERGRRALVGLLLVLLFQFQ